VYAAVEMQGVIVPVNLAKELVDMTQRSGLGPRVILRFLLTLFLLICTVTVSSFSQGGGPVQAQSAIGASSPRQESPSDWQTAAGGKMNFEVASIRPSAPGTFTPPSFPLSNDDSYRDVHGVFSADFPLSVFIEFAYKLRLSPDESKAMFGGLPKWVTTESFTIRARATGDPTKDQMRLMVQALLAERFKLAIHSETHVFPVLALTLDSPGKTGPKLRPHAEGPACDVSIQSPAIPGGLPAIFPGSCNVFGRYTTSDQKVLYGSRDTTMQLLAASLPSIGNLDRSVVDQTGLTGKFDFTLFFALEPKEPLNDAPSTEPVNDGTTFSEALKSNLG
jgi:bla regulator protein blaR1